MSIMVKVATAPFEIAFEVGSIEEAIGYLQEKKARWAELFELSAEVTGQETVVTNTPRAGETAEQTGARTRKPRTPKGNSPDPATASAPPPLPVAPPMVPAPAAPMQGIEMPQFLTRDANNQLPVGAGQTVAPPAPVAAPVPVPAAPPPPMPAPAAPANRLAPLVIAECRKRATGAADGGQALADWLAQYGLVNKASKFEEAMAVLPFLKDDQLAGVAGALGIN